MTFVLHPPITSRLYGDPSDLPKIVSLLDCCEQVDQLEMDLSLSDLQRIVDHPPPGGTSYWQLWENAQGDLIGMVRLWVEWPTDIQEVYLDVIVHPAYRNQGWETELFAWAERYAQDCHHAYDIPLQAWTGAPSDRPYCVHQCETHGYEAVRWFNELERSLQAPIPEPQFPEGFQVRCCQDDDLEAWVEMFNQTFVDHWHFVPLTTEERQHRRTYPTYCPELDWVAIAPDGTLAAFCKAHIPWARNQRLDQTEGHIHLLGTRRGFRRQGLARALLLMGLHHLQDAGMTVALLGVDSNNPNQAKRLYESVGFKVKRTYISYTKSLSAT